MLYGKNCRYFDDEMSPKINHEKKGTVAMHSVEMNCNGSIFDIVLPHSFINSQNPKHNIFGEISEGFNTMERINITLVDINGHPIEKLIIKQTNILIDPFPDLPGLDKQFYKYFNENNSITNI